MAEVRTEIASRIAEGGPAAALAYLRGGIGALADAAVEEAEQAVACYVMLLATLVLHERHDLLSDREVDHVTEHARGLLSLAGIGPSRSTLSFLHANLHTVRGQIYRRQGRHWHAAWEQEQARRAADGPEDEVAFHAMVRANRLMRLGHATEALAEWSAAAPHLAAPVAQRCRIDQVRTLTLLGRFAEADALSAQLRADRSLAPALALELDWQRLVTAYRAEFDARLLLRAIGRRGAFRSTSYVAEACLWITAGPHPSTVAKLPSLARRRRVAGDDAPAGADLEIARGIQQAADVEVAPTERIHRVGEALKKVDRLVTVDKALLAWGAGARVLHRLRAGSAATLVQGRYEALSRVLSDGATADLLGLFAPPAPR
jgi:hypothetical protein